MTSSKKRLLITGASGFIGSHICAELSQKEEWAEIHALSRSTPTETTGKQPIHWHQGNLLDAETPAALIDYIKPSHIIHGAWVTDHGAFWAHKDNEAWLTASLKLAEAFARTGGERFINLGSVAEYSWQSGHMIEGETPEEPSSLYGESKLAFHRALSEQSRKGQFSSATGRIFFVYGPNEKPQRLVPSACRALITGQPESFGAGHQWRDYMHVSDLVRGILALTHSSLEGAVNLASGLPVQLSFILDELEKLAEKPGALIRGTRTVSEDDIPILFGHAARLASTGWRPTVPFKEGLSETLKWWRAQLLKD
jgi:nucleoside-diphosphate-sugar epimerase